MDEALKALAAEQTTTPAIQAVKEAPMPGKLAWLKSWLVIHPKVKAAAKVAAVIAFVAFDNAYNGGETYRQAAHDSVGGILVTIGSYLGANKVKS